MKILLEYDESTGMLKDKNGVNVNYLGLIGFDIAPDKPPVLDLIKQGLTTDDIIKLRNNDLIYSKSSSVTLAPRKTLALSVFCSSFLALCLDAP